MPVCGTCPPVYCQVKEHLGLSPEEEPRLLPEEEPRLLPGGDDEELALLAELAKMAGRNQVRGGRGSCW
jgi:hypothetical protein